MKEGTKFTAYYQTPVYKSRIGGWREEWVVATLEAVSDKMAIVVSASVDDRTSKRQAFCGHAIEEREKGKKKRIACLRGIKLEA